jgi:hypothetical protein
MQGILIADMYFSATNSYPAWTSANLAIVRSFAGVAEEGVRRFQHHILPDVRDIIARCKMI